MTDLAMSRRAVTRALATLSVASIPTMASAAPMLVCAPSEQIATDARAWNAAMTHYLKVKADGETYDRLHVEPHYEAARAKFGAVCVMRGELRWAEYQEWCAVTGSDAISDQWEIMAHAEGGAQTALLEMPAPDMAALRWKLEQTVEADGEIVLWSEKIALSIRSDFLRLLPAEV